MILRRSIRPTRAKAAHAEYVSNSFGCQIANRLRIGDVLSRRRPKIELLLANGVTTQDTAKQFGEDFADQAE